MRLNVYIAQATGIGRRAADQLIMGGQVRVNNILPTAGYKVEASDVVTLRNKQIYIPSDTQTILMHKPTGYVVSRNGQGSKTIYELLPEELHHLKPIGRLDKDSSGLLLLTNDGQLAEQLTHPRYEKQKRYVITLKSPLQPLHHQMIHDHGIMLADGLSCLSLEPLKTSRKEWQVIMKEGRNRQIRRTFEALGYQVIHLHRTEFGSYRLGSLAPGKFRALTPTKNESSV
jgi:23S rRNA pseudouridine2605 synthase